SLFTTSPSHIYTLSLHDALPIFYINPIINPTISKIILIPHNQKKEKRICFPISSPASPRANQRAGENGLTKVPTIVPINIAYVVANDGRRNVKPILYAPVINATAE